MIGQGWAVLQCKPREEFRVCRNCALARQGFVTYRPMIRPGRPIDLFPGYVFVCLTDRWYGLLSIPGVVRVLMAGERPSLVPDFIIRELRAREDKQGYVRLPRRRLHPGQPVRITAGSLLGQCGIHEGSSSHERIRILLELLGRKVSVELPERNVEPITTACKFG